MLHQIVLTKMDYKTEITGPHSIQYMTNKYHRKSYLEIVNILPNVSLHLSRGAFWFEPPSFIYHPSVRRVLQLVGSALTAFVL